LEEGYTNSMVFPPLHVRTHVRCGDVFDSWTVSENEHSISSCFDTALQKYHTPVLKGFFSSRTQRESITELTKGFSI